MNPQQFKGTGVAIVTPFLDGTVDYPALERIIEHVIKGGVNYIVALGSTGEAVLLNKKEQVKVLSFIVEKVNKRLPIVAGHFGGHSTLQLIEKAQNTDFTGVTAIMSSSPSYVKPTQEGIYQHYMAFSDASPLPIIAYNVPSRTGSNMTPTTAMRLANDSSNIIGVKDATGDIAQSIELAKDKPKDFLILSGDDPSAMAHVMAGGDGVISVISNSIPKAFTEMINAALAGQQQKAAKLNGLIHNLHHWMYVEGNPTGVKAALHFQGFCSKEMRLPLMPMTDESYRLMSVELEQFLLTSHKVS